MEEIMSPQTHYEPTDATNVDANLTCKGLDQVELTPSQCSSVCEICLGSNIEYAQLQSNVGKTHDDFIRKWIQRHIY